MCTIWGDEIRLKQHVHNIRRWFIFSSANNNVYNICTWSESWKSQDTKRFGLVRPSDRRASCKTWHVVLGTNLLVQLFMQTWKTNYQYQKRKIDISSPNQVSCQWLKFDKDRTWVSETLCMCTSNKDCPLAVWTWAATIIFNNFRIFIWNCPSIKSLVLQPL